MSRPRCRPWARRRMRAARYSRCVRGPSTDRPSSGRRSISANSGVSLRARAGISGCSDRPRTSPSVPGIAATCKVVTNLAGRTTLEQAVDLMSLADAVVSNDSGLMHVAAALDGHWSPCTALPTPGFTPPLNADHEIVNLGLDCSPCFERECPLGTTACLVDMSVAQVAARAARGPGQSRGIRIRADGDLLRPHVRGNGLRDACPAGQDVFAR